MKGKTATKVHARKKGGAHRCTTAALLSRKQRVHLTRPLIERRQMSEWQVNTLLHMWAYGYSSM